MATNSKVFVSPGVYTSEVDLSSLILMSLQPISVEHHLKNLLTHKYRNMKHLTLLNLIYNNLTNYSLQEC